MQRKTQGTKKLEIIEGTDLSSKIKNFFCNDFSAFAVMRAE